MGFYYIFADMMDVHHKIGYHHMMSAHHFKIESESRLFKRPFSFVSSQRYNEVQSEVEMASVISTIPLLQEIGILPRTTKVCSRQLGPYLTNRSGSNE